MKQASKVRRRFRLGALLGLLLAVVWGGVLFAGLRKVRAEEERGRQLLQAISGITNYWGVGPEKEAGRELVERHAAQIAIIRSLVGQRCRFPSDLAASLDNGERYRHGVKLEQAANLLSLAAIQAASQRRYDEAMELYVDCIRLGQVGYRSGPLFRAAGVVCATGGWSPLQRLARSLTAEQCRTVLQQAAGLEPTPVIGTDVAIRDALREGFRVGRQRMNGGSLGSRWYEGKQQARWAYEETLRWGAWERNSISGLRERALVSLALRAFVLEQGRGPTNLTEVVPAYLPTAPESDALRAKLGGK